MDDVCAGTARLRQMSTRYLPMEPAEDRREYDRRLSKAILYNVTERTLNALAGMVFQREPRLARDVPESMRELWENIDNTGTHGAVFINEAFISALKFGHGLIYVDMPPPLPTGATLEDERNARRRPYWVFYEANQIINWRYVVRDGQQVLTLLVLQENTIEPDGVYGEANVTRYRVLQPGRWEIYREVLTEKRQTEYILEDAGVTSLPYIPVAPIYSRKIGNFTSRPFLIDLAFLNIAHFQKYDDYSLYLHIASRPILWFRGRNQAKAIEPIGPYVFFDVDQINGYVDFAETTGSALGAARTDLEDLKAQMASMGLSLLVSPSTHTTTATEQLISKMRSDSDLAMAARSLQDAAELALSYTAEYMGITDGGSLELATVADSLMITAQEMQAWSQMVATGQLSLETLWSILERTGKLPADFDPEVEHERIEEMAALVMPSSNSQVQAITNEDALEDPEEDSMDSSVMKDEASTDIS